MVVDPIVRTVLSMMSRYGGDGELIAKGDAVYDPATSRAVSTTYTYPVRAMVFDYTKKMEGVAVGDMMIRAGDKQVFIKPDDTVPAPQARMHSLVWQGTKYNIIVVKELNPTGTNPLLYELYVRE